MIPQDAEEVRDEQLLSVFRCFLVLEFSLDSQGFAFHVVLVVCMIFKRPVKGGWPMFMTVESLINHVTIS